MSEETKPPVIPPVTPPETTTVPPVSDEISPELKAKVEGKSTVELAKMYGELERKMGEMGKGVEERDGLIKQMNVVLTAIGKDPARGKMVKDWIREISGEKDETTVTPGDKKVDDTRKAIENDTIKKFESRYGLDKLTGDDKKAANQKIGQALWEIVDPEGKYKNYDEMMDNIPLRKLDKMLENAYWIANRDVISEKVRLDEETKRKEAQNKAIGSLSSASLDSNGETTMSAAEVKAAEKLGISQEKWKERKKQIAKGT